MNINNFYDKLQALCGEEDPRTDFHFKREIEPALSGKTLCLCGQPIKRRFEIQSCETKSKAIVGSTCFKRFLPAAYKEYQLTKARRCGVCNEPHKCRLDEYCSGCRGGVFKKGITYRTYIRMFPKKTQYLAEYHPESEFSQWLEANGGYVWCGKYKFHTAKEIYDKDQQYAEWAQRLPRASPGLRALRDYRP